MDEFVRPPTEGKLPIRGALGFSKVKPADMVTTTIESLSDGSSAKWEIAGVLVPGGPMQEEEPIASPTYVACAYKAGSSFCWTKTTPLQLQHISIPSNVRELCDRCFSGCSSLRCVTFAGSPSLERIGVSCFECTGIEEVSIPKSVRELCDRCFKKCWYLRRVRFDSSSLERIGVSCFEGSRIEEVNIPKSVRELCNRCFCWCSNLHCVTFGSSVSFDRIGVSCFEGTGVQEVTIPYGVRELCDCCFRGCRSLRRVTFYSLSLERIGISCFEETKVEDVSIPDGVRELCDRCFRGCNSLRRVTFGALSSLERIGVGAFLEIQENFRVLPCGIVGIDIPDTVRELGNYCFKGCKSLRRVTFGSSSSLERIGVSCFEESALETVSIPDGVLELCDRCFRGCKSLRRVTFGSFSSLERIGVEAFGMIEHWITSTLIGTRAACKIVEIDLPATVCELRSGCFKGCSRLHRVTFRSPSSLARIGVDWIQGTLVDEVCIPNNVHVDSVERY